MKIFSIAELRRYDGDDFLEIYICVDGKIYDVSDCPKWKTGLHEGQHFGGQDLSYSLAEAPHGSEVFNHPCLKLVGYLAEK